MRRVLFPALCVLATAVVHPSTPAPSKPDKLQLAVERLMVRMYQDEKGLHVGMDASDVAKEMDGAASVVGDLFLPLERTTLAPKGGWTGVVNAFVDPDEETLPTLEVVLLCGKYDKGKMGEFLVEAAHEKGIELERTDDDRNQYFNAEGERALWIALGDELIVLSIDADGE